ncbi:MAG: hypothetical protein ACLP5V_16470 [Candidatus Bathyarchaeia archaeon]
MSYDKPTRRQQIKAVIVLIGLIALVIVVLAADYHDTQAWYGYCSQLYIQKAQGNSIDTTVCDSIQQCDYYDPLRATPWDGCIPRSEPPPLP